MIRFFTAFSAFVILSVSHYSFAQNIRWNAAPQKGFVFEISNKEAQKLLTRTSPDTIFNGLLYSLIDTFSVDKGWTNRPAKGHFILARISENKLHCEYTSVFPYQVFLLKEYDALALQVLDLNGNVRDDAKVKFRFRKLRIDPETKTYRLHNDSFYGDTRIVTVEFDDFRSVFNIEKHEVPSWYNDYSQDDGPDFYSYMITDKNKYKPNESVRFKSFALSQSRSPLRKALEVWLVDGSRSIRVGQVSPHRPGSYAADFLLHDSLKLTLDKRYMLQLVEKGKRIVSSCNFRYEDYELHGNKLEIELKTKNHHHPDKNQLSILATDINGLILKDAHASILVKTQNIRETFQPILILPDTLLFQEIDLNTDKATVVDVPSELFEKSNTAYEVHVAVLNSQNQRMERKISATHFYEQYALTSRFSNDSIVYEMWDNETLMQGESLRLFYNDDVKPKEVVTPFKEKLNPAINRIRLESNRASRDILMRNLMPLLEIKGGIEKDSFKIALDNPQRLDVSWYIYQGSLLLQKGFGKELDYRSIIDNRNETYYVELLYSFGGFERLKRKEFEFREEHLNVSLEIPERIYPGQTADVGIQVTNQLGDPVSGVDLTAMGVTAKLNYQLPDLPYYGKSSVPRSQKAHYTKNDISKRTAVLNLDYKRWERELRLDTMKYYQFTFPDQSGFTHTTIISDSTQFAPFVMKDGIAQQIYVIEVNRKPVYYSWVDQPDKYAFYISPVGKHQISLRLWDRVVILDSMSFNTGKKTIFSIDLDHLPEDVQVYQMYAPPSNKKNKGYKVNPTFTSTEKNRHITFLASFTRTAGNSWLESGLTFVPLFNAQFSVRKETIVAGPITPGKLTYADFSGITTTYQHTGGYSYTFADNIVYKSNPVKLFPDFLVNKTFNPMTIVNDLVITKEEFLKYKTNNLSKWFATAFDLFDNSLTVRILLPEDKEAVGIAAFLFEDCATGHIVSPCRNYTSGKTNFYTIPRGWQNAIVIYSNGQFLKMDSINLKSFTHVIADLKQSSLHPFDSISETWLRTPFNNCYNTMPAASKSMVLQNAGATYGNVMGNVYDEANMPLPGATILIKGTESGTSANIEGEFALDIDEPTATLIISFIGYQTKEIQVQVGSDVSVHMTPDIMQLSEVVVVGYGTNARSSLTAALSGRIAGVNISSPDSDYRDKEVPEEDDQTEVEIKRDAEQQLYQELLALNTIRSNFSDVAFWEPRLFTDRQGRSSFSVVFPDDITRWDATVYAMNRYLQTGTVRKSIKAYKPLMAELHVPQFLTQGDSSFFMGKVLNYTRDKEIMGKVGWNSETVSEKSITFNDFYADLYLAHASNTDSIKTRFVFNRDDGYLDGEERSIPVVESGILRVDGTLSILQNQDTLHVKAKDNEKVTMEILNNPIDIYHGEARHLVEYKYACNEQLASKLVGLIQHKLLMQYEGKPFRFEKDVNTIIRRLLKNQNEEFLWSWWDVSSNTSYWMSAHILRALKVAADAGYKVDLNIENIAQKARYKFDILHQYTLSDTDLLHALASWNANLAYAKHIEVLDSIIQKIKSDNRKRLTEKLTPIHQHYPSSLMKEMLLLQETRQLVKLPYHRDTLLQYRREGIMGDIYFSDDDRQPFWYNDDLASNTIAYRIVRRDSLLQHMLLPMQMYFLAQRKNGRWNTYHGSNILLTVLPDLLAEGVTKGNVATLRINGKVNGMIDKFPFKLELMPEDSVSVLKESGLPLYYMQYTEERVTYAKTGVEGFTIKTSLGNGRDSVFQAGIPVQLTVQVEVKKDATLEYVMIEVPIPGACSYADKGQRKNPVETHREYFKERTVIFCEKMKPGNYTFVVHLLPRFTGRYLINPAQVSLMYVPVVNANTDISGMMVR